MARALELARCGLGRVEPNPMVGAVLADGRQIIAQGHHRRFGEPHAEALVLTEAGDKARGATLYVTLEPCCHQGKTPPCSEAILAAGVGRVVAAMEDPFAKVRGRGCRRLQEAGLDVQVGLLETQARRLNAPFIKRQETGRPYVIAKWAMTLDGRLAAPGGDSKWISDRQSRRWVHSLRSRVDGILVGCGTVIHDDPLLTVRLEDQATDYGRRPVRIVLDERLEMPPESKLLETAGQAAVLVFTRRPADGQRAARLAERGATVIQLPGDEDGLRLAELLDELGRRDMTNLLVEGGRLVLSSFFRQDQVDSLAVFIAPKLIGGPPTHAAPGPDGLDLMSQAVTILRPTYTPIGEDILVQGVLRDY
ncbi:MAG: bifunctional diaminohydroxyphosphoribosylaminopyrimidine deaminase/5-amino-6-(5-phosphoribosylamino)uracil reductase RibD [Anaerolineaceae bacterium]|nr:bifunctional diaminohydroxyphosphoribosylaminopyrimidine deaminase/5-amino-6-(5-phosphoribosylamino)uracil reductase RibD [Anaerolineaceae bacterium]